MSGDTINNHLMYADDLVLISPSATGMKELLCACEVYSVEHAIIYNSKKSTVLEETSKEPVCPRVELILKIIIILLIIFLGFSKNKPC